ncbi:MAG: winged helix-turn-helix domain-containing protein, partial [Bryobacteraceae bacterium]
MRQRSGSLRFDVFQLDVGTRELRRHGSLIRLQDKPFELLKLLLETPGEAVSREVICRRLWGSETFVEFDDSLNHAVRKLREALGDSVDAPRFIETLPRQGYRFLGDLQFIGHGPQQRHVGRARELTELRQWFDTA